MSEKGFTLLEMLVSLSIFLMISIFIIPSLIQVLIDRENLIIRNEGNVLLIEQLNHYNTIGTYKENVSTEGIDYYFYINNNRLYVYWTNRKNVQEKISYEVTS